MLENSLEFKGKATLGKSLVCTHYLIKLFVVESPALQIKGIDPKSVY